MMRDRHERRPRASWMSSLLPASAKNTRNTGSCADWKLCRRSVASARDKLRSQMPAASMTINGSRCMRAPISATIDADHAARTATRPSSRTAGTGRSACRSATPNTIEPRSSHATASAVPVTSILPPITAPVTASTTENRVITREVGDDDRREHRPTERSLGAGLGEHGHHDRRRLRRQRDADREAHRDALRRGRAVEDRSAASAASGTARRAIANIEPIDGEIVMPRSVFMIGLILLELELGAGLERENRGRRRADDLERDAHVLGDELEDVRDRR